MSNSERNLETLPTGSLGIIPLQSCQELGEKVDKYLVKWRDERQHQHQNDAAFMGYKRDSYIIEAAVYSGNRNQHRCPCRWNHICISAGTDR